MYKVTSPKTSYGYKEKHSGCIIYDRRFVFCIVRTSGKTQCFAFFSLELNMSLFLSLLLRCMEASQSLVCANVAQKCSIEGCGHNIRHSLQESHMREHQGSHVQLLQNQLTKAIWNADQVCHFSHNTTKLNNPYLVRVVCFP